MLFFEVFTMVIIAIFIPKHAGAVVVKVWDTIWR